MSLNKKNENIKNEKMLIYLLM